MKNFNEGTALVTGASSGIGQAYAEELARRGMNLVLVARSLSKLEALAETLRQRNKVRVHVIRADLSHADAADQVFKKTEELGVRVNLLINNAGFATYGRFGTLDLGRELEEVMVNTHAVVALTGRFLPRLVEAKEAGIISVCSTAAFQPLPYMATYGATKAFVLSFSEALWAQFKNTNVRVIAVCPGPVATDFHRVVGAAEAQVGKPDTPEHVVLASLRALSNGRSFVVPRFSDYLLTNLARFLPRSMVAMTSERVLRPKTPKKLPEAGSQGARS
jgi:uncharacterized protein